MSEARWTNPSQPQTMQIAVFLLYIGAAFGLLSVLTVGVDDYLDWRPWGPLLVLSVPAAVVAGRGIASEQKWGYALGIGVAAVAVLATILGSGVLGTNLIGLMFDIALLALLLHPMSRDYQRIWFK